MLFMLNQEKRVGFLSIGKTVFTFDDPGPKDVNLESATQVEIGQLVYNGRKGVLLVEDPDKLLSLVEEAAPIAKEEKKEEVKQDKKEDIIEEENKKLRKILKKSVSSVKKSSVDLTTGQIRRMKNLESSGKNRKSLLSFFNEILDKHSKTVTNTVGNEDVEGKYFHQSISSPQVSEVIEDSGYEVKLIPSE